MGVLYTIAAFIFALGILIVVHEFGHYWVAKTLGVKVLRFSVGFGKPLWRKNFGKDSTEFVVAAIPLGGYVKMLDENEADVAEHERARAFNRQSIAKRCAIVVAGPAFNFIFAIIAYWLLFLGGINDIKPVIDRVEPGSVAQRAGFQQGDTIQEFNGYPVEGWEQYRLYLFNQAIDGAKLNVKVKDAAGQTYDRQLDLSGLPIKDLDASFLEKQVGLYVYVPVIFVHEVLEGPAKRAGLQVDDVFVQINGRDILSSKEFLEVVSSHPGKALEFTVRRGEELRKISVTPEAKQEEGKTVGRLGITFSRKPLPDTMRIKIRYGPLTALWKGTEKTWDTSILTLKILYKILTLEVSAKNISGPITIAQVAGQTAQIGLEKFVQFLALVSISLGVLNLLPIPILDGGHLLFYVVEAIKGSPVSDRVLLWGQQIGLLMLISIMILAFYNDFTRLLH